MRPAIARTKDIATCLAIRRRVFIDEQKITEADELDGLDDTALHILATLDGQPAGTARILMIGDTAKIGRVCVLPQARGTGLGAGIILACLDVARAEAGVTTARLGAQVHALEFYEKLGFSAYGPIYDDAGIPHRDLECTL